MQLLKKMSAANIVGKVKTVVADLCETDLAVADLYTIYGTANGIQTGEHATNGPWTAFLGNFEAVNLITGELSKSGKAFLQSPLGEMMEAALRDADEVSFSCTIRVKRRDDLAVGYEYLVEPHIEATQADPLAHIRQLTQKSVPKLTQLEATPDPSHGVPAKAEPEKPAKASAKKA